jgi:hypothetical protein
MHREYLRAQAALGPSGQALRGLRMSAEARRLMKESLRRLHPALTEADLHALFLRALSRCQNQNY